MTKRLEAYHQQTAPLLPYYDKENILVSIDGMADIVEVTRQIEEIIGGTGKLAAQ